MKSEHTPLPKYQGSLSVFAARLREYLRLSQQGAAAHFHLDRSRVSRYENSRAKDTPRPGYLAGLACLIAERLDNQPDIQQALLAEVNEAIRLHYEQRRFATWQALSNTAQAYLAAQRAKAAAKLATEDDAHRLNLESRLDLPPQVELVGVEHHFQQLLDTITAPQPPWLICLDGLGGIGKTALANAIIRSPDLEHHFRGLAWVSARQQKFSPGSGLAEITGPALEAETLIDTLLDQLENDIPPGQPAEQKQAALLKFLKNAAYFIVIDNLETVVDYQALLPTLLKFANPSKFLLTSRRSLQAYSHIYSLEVPELNRADTLQFIRAEAAGRRLAALLGAAETQLGVIYDTVGGNPLALKLIAGQTCVLPLAQVLENLKLAQGKKIQELYTYIYWQSWRSLSPVAQQALLAMVFSAAQGSTFSHLLEVSDLEAAELSQALEELAAFSLVETRFDDLGQHRYRIHRLTETFLLNEATRWQSSP